MRPIPHRPPLASETPSLLGSAALIAAIGLFWGGNWPAVRFILMELPPFTLRAIGFSAGALMLLAWACLRRLPLQVPASEWPWLIVTGAFTILGFNLATAFGQLHMPTSQAAIIAFSMPCWALLLAWWILGQRITRGQWLGLACGQTGLLTLLGPTALASGSQGLAGPMIMLGAALSWALGTVLIKRRGVWQSHVVVITGWQLAFCALPMLLMMVWRESPPHPATWQSSTWWALGYHLLFSVTTAQILWFLNVNRLSVGQATLSTLIIPSVGVSSAILLLGEPFTPRIVIALMLTLVAVAIVMLNRRSSP